MALSLEEQLLVQRGELKPNDVDDQLIELVHASAINFAINFNVSYKQFDTVDDQGEPTNQAAKRYLDKMLSVCQKAIRDDSDARQSLMIVMASIISNVEELGGNPIDVTPGLIEAATSEQWEAFINMSIQQAFELFANVRIDEKAEYGAIV